MAAVIANLAAGVSGDGAPRLLVGTGRDQKHLVVVATADRGLAGGFNSSIVRAAREQHRRAAAATARTSASSPSAARRRDQLRRLYGDRIDRHLRARRHATPRSDAAAAGRRRHPARAFEAGEADVVTLFYSRFKSVVSQVPTARQLIPAEVEAGVDAAST